MAGLTDTGYTIPRLAEIIEELKAKAVELFQDLVPEGDVVNTSDNSTLGRLIGVISPSLADAWEASQDVYDSFNINAATGIALDNLVALGGVQRQPASSTITTVKLTGATGTTVPLNTQFQSVNNGQFHRLLETITLGTTGAYSVTATVLTVTNSTDYTISYQKNPDSLGEGVVAVTITSDGSATEAEILASLEAAINSAPHNTLFTATVTGSDLKVESIDLGKKFDFSCSTNLNLGVVERISTVASVDTGPIEQPISTITRISVPVPGLTAVTNPLAGIIGTDRESDAVLRARYAVAKFGDGQSLIESLYSALYSLDGVESVVIIENDTDTTLIAPNPPVPPHSFYTVVLGGESQEIGQAIWDNKPAGILAYGTNTITVYDSQEVGHTVAFDRPTSVAIYVTVNITVQSNFAPNGVDLMKQAIADHINALLIGDDVIYSRLYTPVNSIPGHYVTSLTIGTSPSPVGTSNITIAYDEKATITAANINIVTS